MSIEVKVPVLPESVSDAIIATWHKKPGDIVRRDENLVDLETDKVVLEVPAPADGILESISAEEGDTVVSDQLLGLVKEQAIEAPKETAADNESTATTANNTSEAPSSSGQPKHGDPSLPPAARKLAAENDVSRADIENGSGRGGRATKADVLQAIQNVGSRPEERVKMTRLRTRIAERMKEAQNTAAILTSFNEVNLQAVKDLRSKYQDTFEKTHGIRLGFMSFFVKACCEALQKHPIVNASVEGDEIVYHGYQDVGVAVSIDRGLVVPVVRNANLLSLAQLETQIRDYAMAARDGNLAIEDLQGGTFTVTNGGVFGSLLSTPLLNPPQSAILGMHTIKERPVVENGEIIARPMMYIALSYDHRIIDGKDAVQFLVTVKELLEDPARMLLGL